MKFKRTKLIIKEDIFVRSPLLVTEQDPEQTEEPQNKQEKPDESDSENLILTVQSASETSNDFDESLKKAIVSIPDSLRRTMAKLGYSIVATGLLSDVIEQSKDSIAWNLVSSAFLENTKQIIIAESTSDQNGNPVPSLNIEGLFRHSVGHALDTLAPVYVTEHFHDKFSDLEKFKYAHTSDMTRLGRDKQTKLAYYVVDGDKSRSECFAECFAALHGGGATYTIDVMSKYFPAVMKQIKELLIPIEQSQSISDTDQGDNQDQTDQEPQ